MSNIVSFTTVAGVIDLHNLASFIVESLLPVNPNGGTYDPRTNTFVRPTDEDVYFVSVAQHERRFHGVPSVGEVLTWLRRVRKLLAVEQYFIGWWRVGTIVVFDVSIAFKGERDVVVAIADAWGQDACYHPASGEVIEVPPPSWRAA